MEVTHMDDDSDVFIENKFAVQHYSKNPKCRSERNRRTADHDFLRLVKLWNLLTRPSDNSCFGRVETIVSDMPYGDCIGTCGGCCQSGW